MRQRIDHVLAWLSRYRRMLLLTTAALAVVVALSLVNHGCNLTGFGECPVPQNTRPEKTLWDWLQLLIVPAVLAGVGLWYSRTEKRTELHIAEQRTQDAILQTYFDQMTELLLAHNLRQSPTDAEVRDIARVRTLIALRRLDPERRNLLLQFLQVTGLVSMTSRESIINFRGADFSDADLQETNFAFFNLQGANFHKAQLQRGFFLGAQLQEALLRDAQLQGALLGNAQLQRANLQNAQLSRANLSFAQLQAADLQKAQLQGANLVDVQLQGANLGQAQLQGANLSGAQLQGASLFKAQLRGAFLEDARFDNADLRFTDITADQLVKAASYQDATLPDHLRNSTSPYNPH